MSMRQSGFKPILISPENHRRLADIGKKRETFNEIISDLIELRNKNIFDAVGLPGNRIPAQNLVAPASKGGIYSNG